MKTATSTRAVIAVFLMAVAPGCSGDARSSDDQSSSDLSAARAEHNREGAEHGGEGPDEHASGGEHSREVSSEHDEESATELALNQKYDRVGSGVRLIPAYDGPSNSFVGTAENTTERTLRRVRVEVHLSNGKELGPTTPVDLEPGAKRSITLMADSTDFDGWTAHPEVGEGEHGGGRGA